ncbi:phosphatidylinositol-binding protein scs2 [Malassezia vespertilionis]|uniref:Scs2p n=1 Tax=Malassezia vespertilionis TaxID=2020962 RepID=A0A2N1J7Y5_9BASI|nr:phosphatidylinositol-binding protein scs2 [Malassezia vespertilionis]PKI82664.1 Scs2p [Malassezia vespertilionis]WFD08584.1 phosphatidylinositol-binding protein scs2 [Malassezia vespertilionis]
MSVDSPFRVAKKSMILTNGNDQPVAFKVKTTAPKQYCVRPNSGRIEPGERVEVQVLLQPMKEEPPASAKCRDKFLVQSALIPTDKETLPINEFWAVQERQKDSVFEHKLRCVFLPSSSATVPEEYEGDAQAVAGAGDVGAGAGAGTAYMGSRGYGGNDFAPRAGAGVQPPITAGSFSAVNTPASQPVSLPAVPVAASSEDLQSEVQRLRAQLNSRTQLESKKGGVPVHIVAAIAIAVFAVTYLFF